MGTGNFNAGSSCDELATPTRGSRVEILPVTKFYLKTGVKCGLMGFLAHMQTLPLLLESVSENKNTLSSEYQPIAR